MSQIEIAAKVKELRELSRMKDELEQEIAAVRSEITGFMDGQGLDTLAGDDYEIRWREVSTCRVDLSALRKALPEIAERFAKVSISKRFCIY